jgi:TonB family protein
MYFDLEDYHPDITPLGRAISWREGVLLSIIAHLCLIIFVLLFPKLFPEDKAARARLLLAQEQKAEQRDRTQFVFVAPRRDIEARRPPPRAEPSDKDREATAPERAPQPTNPLPFSRGNSFERVEAPPVTPPERARGQGPTPDPAQGQQAQAEQPEIKVPDSQSQMPFQTPKQDARNNNAANGKSPIGGGSLGDALRNLQRYVPREQFENPGGNGGQFGPEIQFDTKGVEFGPWIRRFIAQVKRNWFIPYAAMSNKGHVVVTFNVHKDGSITDLSVVGPCPIEPFNNAAFGALSSSNPTVPLPPEYPSEKAFFTVTFFYNETPP